MNYTDLFRVTLPELVLDITALVVLVADLGFLRRAQLGVRLAVAALLGVAGCGVAAYAAVVTAGHGGLHYPEGGLLLTVGGPALIAQVGILALTALTLLLFIDSRFTEHVGEFVAIVLMAATGALLISAAQDLLVIFVGLELLSLGLYILTAFARRSGESAEAAINYYLFGGMSAAFLLFGFSYLYGITGSTSLHEIAAAASGARGLETAPLLAVALVMVAAGLGFKVAAVPFHLWAPDAYEGAPAPGAAFIASVSKVASFALLISIGTATLNVFHRAGLPGSPAPLGAHAGPVLEGIHHAWPLTLTVMAVASIVVGNLAALAQTRVRRLLAYSAISHAGYLLLGLAFFSPSSQSARAILYYILTYGLTTLAAFGAVGVVERSRGSDHLDSFSGLSRQSPLLAAVLLILFLSLAGIPPLVGFWAKFNLFAAVLSVYPAGIALGLVALALAMSAVSLYYYLQVLKRVYVAPGDDHAPIRGQSVTMLVVLLVAVAVVGLGCFPALLEGWMANAYHYLVTA